MPKVEFDRISLVNFRADDDLRTRLAKQQSARFHIELLLGFITRPESFELGVAKRPCLDRPNLLLICVLGVFVKVQKVAHHSYSDFSELSRAVWSGVFDDFR